MRSSQSKGTALVRRGFAGANRESPPPRPTRYTPAGPISRKSAWTLITAEIRLRRMFGAFAAGRILNAKTARSQLIG